MNNLILWVVIYSKTSINACGHNLHDGQKLRVVEGLEVWGLIIHIDLFLVGRPNTLLEVNRS